MAATPIAASSRYINPETTQIYFVPTIANIQSPTRSELNAGTDVTDEVQAVEGWLTTSEQVETPGLGKKFVGKIPGRTGAEDSSITYYADEEGNDARTLNPRGTTGNIVFFDGGDIAARKMDIYPIKVSSVGKTRSVEGTEAATVTISYSITDEPAEDVEVPA